MQKNVLFKLLKLIKNEKWIQSDNLRTFKCHYLGSKPADIYFYFYLYHKIKKIKKIDF